MDDGYYRRKVMRNEYGGYVLTAEALAPFVPLYYPPFWFCTHEDREHHKTIEDALCCSQYEEFMQQVR